MKKAKLIIQCKSDLCMGSGFSYAGIIDSDVCYDKYGLPYIPAKRLRGCMRDAAESVLHSIMDEERVNEIFGVPGQKNGSSFIVSNAYLKNHAELAKELTAVYEGKLKTRILQQDVLDSFTRIQAQTKIENGIALDSSLRYTRIANQYLPYGESEEVEYQCVLTFEDSHEDDIRKIVKALRNIGMKRNRGYGQVVCKLEPPVALRDNIAASSNSVNGRIIVNYQLNNIDPLMLGSNDITTSEQYIKGQMILGCLAGRFLANGGWADSDEFRKMFLDGSTIYSNAYPSVPQGTTTVRCHPAPQYIQRLKLTGSFVNTLIWDSPEDVSKGNLPKLLTGSFINVQNNEVLKHDVDMEIIYHHSLRGENKKQEPGLLYSQEAVSKGQSFAGYIITDACNAELIELLLKEGDALHLGRSRNSQYGRCVIGSVDISSLDETSDTVAVAEGEKIIVVFRSDAAFVNESGNYTVNSNEVRAILSRELGLNPDCSTSDSDIKLKSGIRTKLLTGYLSVWNLRKQPIPVIEAGSFFEFTATEGNLPVGGFVGERNMDGLGEYSILKKEDFKNPTALELNKTANETDIQITRDLIGKILFGKLIRKQVYLTNPIKGIDATQLGRITLMLEESIQANPNSKKCLKNFEKRVMSIKTDSVKNIINKKLLGDCKNYSECLHTISDEYIENIISDLKKIYPDSYNNKLNELWTEYARLLLIKSKYAIKE